MVLMKWSDSFSVGVPLLDQQHKQLVGLINRLNEAVRVSVKNPAIQDILNELVQVTASHFETEEKLMRQTGFAELEEHHEVHQKLFRAVAEVMEKVNSGKLAASANLAAFLHFWLEKHIEEYDHKYARHIANLKTAGLPSY